MDSLPADRGELARFIGALFRYADENTYASLRAFHQFRRDTPPEIIWPVKINGDLTPLVDRATEAAAKSAAADHSIVFAPPICTFTNPDRARGVDLANGLTLSVELDEGDTLAARRKLESLLGPATVIVASGGDWTDPQTGEVHTKLHLHWRLNEPTRDAEEHGHLRHARDLAAHLAGADPTGKPVVHPLRWPGSWNTKDKPRLARIVALNESAEITLTDAVEALGDAVEAAGLNVASVPRSSDPQAPLALLKSAMHAIPNAGIDVHYDTWIRLGYAVYRASGGAGFDMWDAWSRKSDKYQARETELAWQRITNAITGSSVSCTIGAGTIFFFAGQAGWKRPEEPLKAKQFDNDLFAVEYFHDIQPPSETQDFVEGLLLASTMCVIYGESNSGKTFFATDLFLHVACGWAWNGREVERGAVIYCALEGAHGIRNRVVAFREEHGLGSHDIPFAVIPVTMDLLKPDADVSKLIATIKHEAQKLGVPVRAVVLDTLSRAMAGGNENAPDDMGALVTNGTRIQQETKAMVCWIHHSGKDAARGARGHSLLRAATETEIEVVDNGGHRTATVTKQRDLECSGVFLFRLKVVEIGTDRRGKPITSCVVEAANDTPSAITTAAAARRKLTPHAKRAYEVLVDLCASEGQSGHVGCPSGVQSVPEQWWRDRFYDRTPGDTQEVKRQAFRRASVALVNDHIVGMANNRVWIVYQGVDL